MITKEMTIEEIFATYPSKAQKLAQVLQSAGLNCVGCGASTWETLEMGVLSHGFSQNLLKEIVDRLNTILQEKEDLSTIAFTKKAAEKYREILEDEGKAGWGLRLGDRAAGCSGFEYTLDYCEKPLPTDEVFTSEGIEIVVDKAQVSRLRGSVIDYVDGLKGSGFKISNPNVKASCGCGNSQCY